MDELAQYVAQVLVVIGGTWFLVRVDERRLDSQRSDRAWPPASRLAACVFWAPWSIPVHFWRTRRSVKGTLLGVMWLGLVVIVGVTFGAFASWLFGGHPLDP